MKKVISIFICLLLVGCNNVSQEKYDDLILENQELKLEIENLKNEYNQQEVKLKNVTNKLQLVEKSLEETTEKSVRISGGFVATLRNLMPDYVLNDYELRLAVCQWFQGNTFVVRIDSDIANQLKVNKTYYFEIETRVIEGYTLDEVNASVYSDKNMINVIGYRQPKEDELGLKSPSITIEVLK